MESFNFLLLLSQFSFVPLCWSTTLFIHFWHSFFKFVNLFIVLSFDCLNMKLSLFYFFFWSHHFCLIRFLIIFQNLFKLFIFLQKVLNFLLTLNFFFFNFWKCRLKSFDFFECFWKLIFKFLLFFWIQFEMLNFFFLTNQ